MNLADKIIVERKKKGWSQEDLAEMLDVSRQSVSKWEGDLSTPEVEKIVKMSELFGVTTDYLLNNNAESTANNEPINGGEKPARIISVDEAEEFIGVRGDALKKIGLGQAICLTSPIIPLLCIGASYYKILNLPMGAAVAIAVLFILIHISIAIAIFIKQGFRLEKFKHFFKEKYELAYGVEEMINEKLENHKKRMVTAIITAIIVAIAIIGLICIFGAMQYSFGALVGTKEFGVICLVSLVLVMVSIITYLAVGVGGGYISYRAFLKNK